MLLVELVGRAQRSEIGGGWIYRSAPLFVLVAISTSIWQTNGFRKDEVKCEEAVSRMSNCCDSFAASSVSCIYSEHSCSKSDYPDLSTGESDCILDLSCDEIVERGLCEFCGSTGDCAFEPGGPPVCE